MSLLPTLLSELQMENEMLHAENALKLTQILDLEQLLYDTRVIDEEDGSPCWCCFTSDEADEQVRHDDYCDKARQATETLWKKVDTESKH